tara:strand:- start:5930 stop:6133 length:204 start_codon:yes stop_codon:yes gene_type:complete
MNRIDVQAGKSKWNRQSAARLPQAEDEVLHVQVNDVKTMPRMGAFENAVHFVRGDYRCVSDRSAGSN